MRINVVVVDVHLGNFVQALGLSSLARITAQVPIQKSRAVDAIWGMRMRIRSRAVRTPVPPLDRSEAIDGSDVGRIGMPFVFQMLMDDDK
jgi:hypothetical protein